MIPTPFERTHHIAQERNQCYSTHLQTILQNLSTFATLPTVLLKPSMGGTFARTAITQSLVLHVQANISAGAATTLKKLPAS
jgi:hypothetical protein